MSPLRSALWAFVLSIAVGSTASAQSASGAAQPAASDIEVKSTDAIHAIVLPMKGSYMQHQEAFQRLGSFLASQGVTPTGAAFGRYFSDPSVGEANLVWEVGFPVSADTKAEAPFEIRDIPPGTAAVRVHRGSLESLGTAWGELVQWVMVNGYQPTGPAFQSFEDPTASVVEMRLPVQK